MDMNKYIDHTLLKATATASEIKAVCDEAIKYDFASVCVNPVHVNYVSSLLAGSDVKVCTVIGFPLGANTITTKAFEATEAVNNGADEIDMVINVGKAKEQDFKYIENEIAAVVKASKGMLVKVILETCYLTDDEIFECCQAAALAGADFVKTSTGFGPGGATAHHVEIMKKAIPASMQVKASGGVRTLEDFNIMVNAGATRIGASSGVKIMEGISGDSNDSNSSY